MRVFLVKNFKNLLCMIMILGKNNRLSQLLSVVDFQAIRHQNMEHLFYRIFVENPSIQS